MRVLLWVFALLSVCCGGGSRYERWQPIEISFQGPASQSLGEPNPFAVRFDIVFRKHR